MDRPEARLFVASSPGTEPVPRGFGTRRCHSCPDDTERRAPFPDLRWKMEESVSLWSSFRGAETSSVGMTLTTVTPGWPPATSRVSCSWGRDCELPTSPRLPGLSCVSLPALLGDHATAEASSGFFAEMSSISGHDSGTRFWRLAPRTSGHNSDRTEPTLLHPLSPAAGRSCRPASRRRGGPGSSCSLSSLLWCAHSGLSICPSVRVPGLSPRGAWRAALKAAGAEAGVL